MNALLGNQAANAHHQRRPLCLRVLRHAQTLGHELLAQHLGRRVDAAELRGQGGVALRVPHGAVDAVEQAVELGLVHVQGVLHPPGGAAAQDLRSVRRGDGGHRARVHDAALEERQALWVVSLGARVHELGVDLVQLPLQPRPLKLLHLALAGVVHVVDGQHGLGGCEPHLVVHVPVEHGHGGEVPVVVVQDVRLPGRGVQVL
mmetsp:Transcript_35470/g.67958  ORF Transcript_35470/g.67958 Transcript_35470/m.67958 type:complete len:203 (-) Transcript_35470:916-1524(-)